ncbi:MAG: NADH-quinone oxidoreductase subunit NuoE [Xanthomonadales bacterium]|nr:NADH-quinone oxidoreductase subunit NuoE [Xanthomonadales bacterium]
MTAEQILTEKTRSRIDHWLGKFPPEQKRSAIIQSLMAAQDQNGGWLSKDIITAVARYLDIPAAWAYEVASFYSMFDLHPVGRHKISICTNISCWLCGAEDVVGHVEKKLGISLGQTTEDGRITLIQEEECLAGCVGAPMMIVDGHYHEHLTPEKVDDILDGLE